MDRPQYTSLQDIVDQLELCNYQTKDSLHELKMNTAFIALKEEAEKEKMLPSEKVKILESSIKRLEDKSFRLTTGNISHLRGSIMMLASYMKQVLEGTI